MLRTDSQFREDISSLPKCHRVALACACSEHVLPLYERNYSRLIKAQTLGSFVNLRSALETAWRYALGEEITIAELKFADTSASSSIPRIDIDHSVEAEMSMSAAVSVLEALDVVAENTETAPERAAFNAMTAVMVACYVNHPNLPKEEDPFPKMMEGCLLHREWEPLVHEWNLQNSILDDLFQLDVGKFVSIEWKSHQAMHGILLLKKLDWE